MADTTKPRGLRDLLEPGFSEGYEQFKELVDFAADGGIPLSREQNAWSRLLELSSVAAIEGLNQVENDYGIEPHEAVIALWSATGAMLATINAQAYRAKGKQAVRREMIKCIKESYDRTVKSLTAGEPREEPAL